MDAATADDLMERFAGGDTAAFEALYDAWAERLYGFCVRLLGDRDAADDAFQETFRRVVDGRHRYRPAGRFDSWLFTIARRICLDSMRTGQRDTSLSPAQEAALAATGPSAHDRLVVNEEILRLLEVLTPEQRQVVVLSRYEGFTYREIAAITGSTEPAVKQMAHRAVSRLRAWRARSARDEEPLPSRADLR